MQATYLEPHQLASMIRGPEASDVLIIDVRDEDFAGGHIKGAVNIESDVFTQPNELDRAIQQHLQPNVSKVVVHCMFSQQRGPRCATRLVQRLNDLKLPTQPSVHVLRNGFAGFVRQYHTEPDLVEEVDTKLWEAGKPATE